MKIKFLKIIFEGEIEPYEVEAFRGAVIEKAGKAHINFHNHLGDNFLYGYPTIQYKRVQKSPAIVSLDYGVDDIPHLFNNKDMEIKIGDRPLLLKVRDLQLKSYNMQVWESTFQYRIRSWLALNQDNHKLYHQIAEERDRVKMLERTLTGNILSMAKGIKWFVEKPVLIEILEIIGSREITYKKTKLLSFDLRFRSNIFLPNYIGLGKGAAHGLGIVTGISSQTQNPNYIE
jgi:hypothetical protein